MKCAATLFYGDECRVVCHREAGHPGVHRVTYQRAGGLTITWALDERCDCPKHGLQEEAACPTCADEWIARECQACFGNGLAWVPDPVTGAAKGTLSGVCPTCEGTGYRSREDVASALARKSYIGKDRWPASTEAAEEP